MEAGPPGASELFTNGGGGGRAGGRRPHGDFLFGGCQTARWCKVERNPKLRQTLLRAQTPRVNHPRPAAHK
ncbi:hypothetical protein EYF80_053187 [Liparis tanakae]|uniref:Uncharacterized protein n=1 Tax=Liparis tanakae TaxID=230148 RepID=A0A4Z2F737_9TELE|nr:hypothetical protein EYF80_053187 [Liparis tanakae]